ncbi:GAF domain-containing protein [Natrinema sp. 1APR25-10V2]|uniref:GAF domain-containing protein n=1 Tax=Natrinema sp. 1APR25-10V2 TaxID=2951081 RepID=UPI002875AF83|nr:GAF domain-containing protein [Natrinema sp. 1APR25-10V2]MDS0476207.1 GAF domain-containing protein [Natrinema sp. 1APR25-10V2]
MTQPPATTRPRTILYVAATDAAASDGAESLEAVDSSTERSARPATTVERVRDWAPGVDCVVFAETPTTAAGSTLLEVADACGETPLILFCDPSYAPTAARSTDGIDGYVRRDTDDAVAHLADEIEWVCHGNGSEGDSGGDEPIVATGKRATTTPGPEDRLLEAVPELVARRDRDRLFEVVVEAAADALERDRCWLSTVHFGDLVPRATASGVSEDDLEPVARTGSLGDLLRTGEPVCIDDLADDDRLSAPLEGVSALCCVPVGDIGVLQVAADETAAFDEDDVDLLSTWGRVAAAALERIDAEESQRRELERLREMRDRLAVERDELQAERDGLAAERDRYRSLFENVPEPAIRYEIDAGQPVVRTVNDTFTEVFGTEPESVVDKPVDEDTVPPGLEHRRATLLESLRSGERRQLVSRRETADGVREFLLTLIPLEANANADADGGSGGDDAESGAADAADHNPEGLIIYSDVTEHNRRERELAAAESRLERIAELIDDDVRTPLNVARGYLELAAETGDREHFAEVDDAQERLRELLDRLVAIAREDDVLVDTEPVAVHDVARRAWVAVETGDARLVTRAAENRVLEADKTRLRELFERLFQAVADGTDDGDEKGTASAGAGDATAVVTVGATDDGFYVARRAAETEAVVDSGLETDPVPGRLAAADGTGFGLGTVERIADAHGWNVGVAEDEGRIAFAFRGVDARNGE